MYLFGFPDGLAGGSKETVYNTGEATFHSTTKSTQYATQYQTSRVTDWNTSHDSMRTTSHETLKSVPYYNPIPLNSPRRDKWGSINNNAYGRAPRPDRGDYAEINLVFTCGLVADPTVIYRIQGFIYSDWSGYYINKYPNGYLSGPNGARQGADGFSDYTFPFTDQWSGLENFQFNIGVMGNARIQLNDMDRHRYYSITIVKDPDPGCPYFFVDNENVSSVNRMLNTSYGTSLGITNYQTSGTTYFQTAHNTSHNTTYETHYQTYHPTSRITYG